jgi:N-carbamoyl-L-amino-acid hydrolase
MAPEVVAVLREEVERLGLRAVELASGAGHDAGLLAAAGVPIGMLFVRSLAGGASHRPEEESSPEDVALGIVVLGAALARLGGRE